MTTTCGELKQLYLNDKTQKKRDKKDKIIKLEIIKTEIRKIECEVYNANKNGETNCETKCYPETIFYEMKTELEKKYIDSKIISNEIILLDTKYYYFTIDWTNENEFINDLTTQDDNHQDSPKEKPIASSIYNDISSNNMSSHIPPYDYMSPIGVPYDYMSPPVVPSDYMMPPITPYDYMSPLKTPYFPATNTDAPYKSIYMDTQYQSINPSLSRMFK